jgi:hypothetical protein
MMAAYAISSTGKDVKEMIPEFYCLPLMFLNADRIPFGTRQDGTVVNHVQLPKWAGNSPRAFVMMLSDALESQFVSENIHKWIDLVFGFRQRGKEAVAAVNVFHALTYEGAVDLSKVADDVQRRSNEAQIDNFGQVPMQVFKTEHKPRVRHGVEICVNPCPTVRFDTALSRTSILLNAERVCPSTSFHIDGAAIAFCRPPMSTASWGADEAAADLFLFSAASRLPIGLPANCLPFAVQGDQPRDYISIRQHAIALVEASPPMKELCCLVLPRLRITCCDVSVPFVYLGTSSGAVAVLEVIVGEFATEVDDAEGLLPNRVSRTKTASIQLLDLLVGHTASVRSLKTAASWGLVVSVGADRVVALWDAHKRVLIRTITSQAPRPPDELFPRSLVRQHLVYDPPFICTTVAVNPKRGDIVVAGSREARLPTTTDTPQVLLYTLNGDLVAVSDRQHHVGAVLAYEPYVFVAEGKSVYVLRAATLVPCSELTHNSLEDVIVSLVLNPYGTLLAACDALGNVATWKVVN